MTDTNETAPETEDAFEWAIVEVFGHRRHAGRILDGVLHDAWPEVSA